jgi:predicted PolB exonuclease-like 3'-5' exonuclease
MNGSVIVWDLETVPDLRGFAAANGLEGKTDEEVRETIGDKFPKHIYHSIVCIGALVARREDDHWAIEATQNTRTRSGTERSVGSGRAGGSSALVRGPA